MSAGATFERVYLALRAELRAGAHSPGTQLEPAVIAERLISSTTPVRDALHRLVGERLVEAPRNDGFRVPILTELSLRHLYEWSLELLLLGIHRSRSRSFAEDKAGLATMAGLAIAIARRSSNPELVSALSQVNDRLAPVRICEQALFPDMEPELTQIRAALLADDRSTLRRALTAYHRRRRGAVSPLIEAIGGSETL